MSTLDEISDRAWAALALHLAGKAGDVGRTGADHRLFLTAVFWVTHHGCAWRALPARFGTHDTPPQTPSALGAKRHLATPVRGGARAGFALGPARFDRRAGPGAGGGQPKKSRVGDEALGRRGGLSTKVHVLVDALGNPLRVVFGPGQQADCRRAAELLAAAEGAGSVLADKGYDTDAVVAGVAALRAQVVIPSKKNRFVQRVIDRNLYRDRHKVERFFNRLKQFRRLAARYEKTARSFLGMVHFVAALLWLR